MSVLQGKEGVCRVEVSRVEWNVLQPWQRTPQSKSSGTAFVIQSGYLLTNAHVVRSATDIRVRPHGSTRRFPAKVVHYAPDVDLALLEIRGEQEKLDFFSGNSDKVVKTESENGGEREKKRPKRTLGLEFADELPSLHQSVHVVGFPTGGNTICVTEGVVSRIDFIAFGWSGMMLTIQIDAAINPGNSGGPVFNSKGQVTGVAFSTHSNKKGQPLNNIGYLIPISIVKAFLGRCDFDHNTYTLSPSIPYCWHSLENKSLRLAHKVPDSIHGVLLTRVCETMNEVLSIGDVLTKIDGKPVADDGQVLLRGDELIQHGYLLRGKCHDEPVVFTVYRNGQEIKQEPVVLRFIKEICPRWVSVDYHPDYLILGTLVLLPLSSSLRSSKKCGNRLAATYMDYCDRWPSEWEGKEGLVVLTQLFSHELSFGYNRPNWRLVETYNEIPIKSLAHLRDLWNESVSKASTSSVNETTMPSTEPPSFVRLGLQNSSDIVFEVNAAIAAQNDILEQQQIRDLSHISNSNPNYK